MMIYVMCTVETDLFIIYFNVGNEILLSADMADVNASIKTSLRTALISKVLFFFIDQKTKINQIKRKYLK